MDEISYSGGKSRIRRKFSKRAVLFGTFAIFGVLLIAGLIFFVAKDNSSETEDVTKSMELPKNSKSEVINAPSPTPDVSPAPTSSPTKAPPKAAEKEASNEEGIKIAVQNGSGESGVAASAAAILRQAGYSIVSTGNADNFNYTNVTIKIKNSQKSFLSSIQKALESEYTIGETSSNLSEGQDYDALVIVGK